jgi:ribonuclease HI
LDDSDSYRFRLPGQSGIFTAEMCGIHFACDFIEPKPMDAYIILTDSLIASIEGLKSTGISYRTNDMRFRTQEVSEISGGNLDMMWIPSHLGIQGNERADVLANEGSIHGTLLQDQAELTTVHIRHCEWTFKLAQGLDY